MRNRLKVLFLCTGNSCRSQMAEGFTRALKGNEIDAYSAGVHPHGLNPLAVKVMAERGIDISSFRSKSIAEFLETKFDYVITVCDDANQNCPTWFGQGRVVHHAFDDPPRLALDLSSEREVLEAYRRVRDEIEKFVIGLPLNLIQK